MENKVVYQMTDEECNEIQDLYERKIALENLIKIVDINNNELYEKIIKDYGKAVREFQNWWDINGREKKWEGSNWFINFQKKQVLCNG